MNRKTIDLRPRQQRRLSRPFNKHNCCSIPHTPNPIEQEDDSRGRLHFRSSLFITLPCSLLYMSLCLAPCSIYHSALLPDLYITLPCSLLYTSLCLAPCSIYHSALLPGRHSPWAGRTSGRLSCLPAGGRSGRRSPRQASWGRRGAPGRRTPAEGAGVREVQGHGSRCQDS